MHLKTKDTVYVVYTCESADKFVIAMSHAQYWIVMLVWFAQEHMRFDNPHRAFTYCLHGYESVVGPVKGVYDKDNSMNKAREHALLVNNRPAYVTILTLGKLLRGIVALWGDHLSSRSSFNEHTQTRGGNFSPYERLLLNDILWWIL